MLVIRPRAGHIDWQMLEMLVEDSLPNDLLATTSPLGSRDIEEIRRFLLEVTRRVAERATASADGSVAAESADEEMTFEVFRSWAVLAAAGGEVAEVS